MELEEILKNIGLSDKEAKTYLALLELGTSTIKPIATHAGIKRTAIYYFIDRLIEIGLITQNEVNNRMRYTAVNPERLMEIEKQRIDKLDKYLPELKALFNLNPTKPRITYFEGPEQMKNILWEELGCKKETLYVWPNKDALSMVGGAEFLKMIDDKRIKKGVWVKAIRFDYRDKLFDTSASSAKYLRELRFDSTVKHPFTMGMSIYDSGKVAFFSSKKEGFAVLVESKELEELMRAFFELLWEKSSPAKPGEG